MLVFVQLDTGQNVGQSNFMCDKLRISHSYVQMNGSELLEFIFVPEITTDGLIHIMR